MSVLPQLSPAELASVLQTVPACGVQCLTEALTTLSNCSATDPACACSNKAVQAGANLCIHRSCTIPEALTTQKATNTICGITSHHERSYTIVIYTFIVATALLVALRFFARLRTRAPLWWDDYSVLVSLLVAIAFTAVCGVFDSLGVGLDLWAVPLENFRTIFILLETALLCYAVSRCFVRISICLFLYRIFSIPGARPWIVWGLVLNVLISISFTFCIIFQCSPVSYFWNKWDGLHKGHCVDQWTMFLAGGIIATALDLYFIVLPIRWVMQLQLSRIKKILAIGMLSLGVIVIITSVMRIVALYNFTHSTNPTTKLPDLVIWGGLELDVAIICACLPSLGPLLKPLRSRLKGWTSWVSKTGGTAAGGDAGGSHPYHSSGHKRLVESRDVPFSKADHHPSSDIRLTTTIQQRQGPPSESETSLTQTMHEIELYDRQRGHVQGHAWT